MKLDWFTVFLGGYLLGYFVRGVASGCGLWSGIGGC